MSLARTHNRCSRIALGAVFLVGASFQAQAGGAQGAAIVDQSRNPTSLSDSQARSRTEPRQCMRRNTYNDIYYVPC
jgi:hypothetical protein